MERHNSRRGVRTNLICCRCSSKILSKGGKAYLIINCHRLRTSMNFQILTCKILMNYSSRHSFTSSNLVFREYQIRLNLLSLKILKITYSRKSKKILTSSRWVTQSPPNKLGWIDYWSTSSNNRPTWTREFPQIHTMAHHNHSYLFVTRSQVNTNSVILCPHLRMCKVYIMVLVSTVSNTFTMIKEVRFHVRLNQPANPHILRTNNCLLASRSPRDP